MMLNRHVTVLMLWAIAWASLLDFVSGQTIPFEVEIPTSSKPDGFARFALVDIVGVYRKSGIDAVDTLSISSDGKIRYQQDRTAGANNPQTLNAEVQLDDGLIHIDWKSKVSPYRRNLLVADHYVPVYFKSDLFLVQLSRVHAFLILAKRGNSSIYGHWKRPSDLESVEEPMVPKKLQGLVELGVIKGKVLHASNPKQVALEASLVVFEQTLILNVGQEDGVRDGMALVDTRKTRTVTIQSVEDSRSIAKAVFFVNEGTKVMGIRRGDVVVTTDYD